MKKKLTRILAALLIAMMLIPALSALAVSAEGETDQTPNINDIENVFELNQLNAAPSKSNKDAEPTAENGMLASKPFELTTLDDMYLYVGPCPDPRIEANWKAFDYIAYWYKPSGAYTSQKKFSELGNGDETNGYPNIVGEFLDGSVILKIKIKAQSNKSSDHKYAALKLPVTACSDYILATVERPFTVDDYYAYADAQGWDIESAGLRPALADEAPNGYEGLWNFFPRKGDRDESLLQQQNANTYVMSEYIPVSANDVITMGAISTKETRDVLYTYDADLDLIDTHKRTDACLTCKEELDYGFGIYTYTVPEGVAYIKVSVQCGVYNDGDILVTRNQPFNAEELSATLGISEASDEAKAHPFYGKNALFVGDSVTYGSYDTSSSYRNPSASWVRRLALATGLIPTNLSYPNASVAKTGLNNVKWGHDLLKPALLSQKNYDMVVFQGGVIDARQNVEVGTALPVNTDRKVLVESERLATFAGGLQLMFKDVSEKWPEAELYFIANFKLVDDSVKGNDLTEYFAQAKILCEAYGVHYIDLYNDTELYKTFDYTSEEALVDLIHPTAATYDVLFPTILRLFNATIEENLDAPTTPDVGADSEDVTTSQPEGTTTPDSAENAEHTCQEVRGWKAFWNSVMNFFRRLFGKPELCTCGEVIEKKN